MNNQSFLYRIFLLLVVLLGGVLATFFFYYVYVLVLNGFDLRSTQDTLAAINTDTSLMRVFQAMQSVLLFILPPFLVCRMLRLSPAKTLSIRKPNSLSIVLAVLSIPVMIPVINWLVLWNQEMHLPDALQKVELWMRASEESAAGVTDLLLSGTGWGDLAINLLLVAVMAGLGEELLFRGLLQRVVLDSFRGKNKTDLPVSDKAVHLSIWVVALLFSAIHLQFYGFIPRLLLGAWFGYLLWWTGSIWVPVAAHITNNAMSTLVVFAGNRGVLQSDPDLWGTGSTWWLCLISLLALFGLSFWFRLRAGRRSN